LSNKSDHIHYKDMYDVYWESILINYSLPYSSKYNLGNNRLGEYVSFKDFTNVMQNLALAVSSGKKVSLDDFSEIISQSVENEELQILLNKDKYSLYCWTHVFLNLFCLRLDEDDIVTFSNQGFLKYLVSRKLVSFILDETDKERSYFNTRPVLKKFVDIVERIGFDIDVIKDNIFYLFSSKCTKGQMEKKVKMNISEMCNYAERKGLPITVDDKTLTFQEALQVNDKATYILGIISNYLGIV
jgi:hypothetical protein